MRSHSDKVNVVKHAAGSSVLLSGSFDKTVKIWDLRSRTFTPIQALTDFKDGVTSICVTNYEIIVSSSDGSIRTYDIRAGILQTDTIGSAITSMSMTHDYKCLVVSCLGGRIKLIDRSNGAQLNEYWGHEHNTFRVECGIVPTDDYIFCGSEDGDICIWDVLESKPVTRLKAHQSVCCSITISLSSSLNDIPILCSSSADGRIIVWSVPQFKSIIEEKENIERNAVAAPYMEVRTRLPLLFAK